MRGRIITPALAGEGRVDGLGRSLVATCRAKSRGPSVPSIGLFMVGSPSLPGPSCLGASGRPESAAAIEVGPS